MVLNLRTLTLAALAALFDEGGDRAEVKFLKNHTTEVTNAGYGNWLQALNHYLSSNNGAPDLDPIDQPLLSLGELSEAELLIITLATAVEDDAMVGRAIALLDGPLGHSHSRPTLSLLSSVFAPVTPDQSPRDLMYDLANGAAVQSGLLVLLNEAAPLAEQAVKVPSPLYSALNRHAATFPGTTVGLGEYPPVPLPPSILQRVQQHAASLQNAYQRVLVLRTVSADEGRSVAAAIAEVLYIQPAFIEIETLKGLGPWLRLRKLLPVFCFDLAPGERKLIHPIPGYDGPLLVLCGPDGSIDATGGTALNWNLPVPLKQEREALWKQALFAEIPDADLPVEAKDLITHQAHYHRHRSGRITQLGHLAHHYAQLEGHPWPTQTDVANAAWAGEGVGLEALAQPLPEQIDDTALVMPARLAKELQALLLRCQTRDGLVQDLGASAQARYIPGVKALFTGPSGTGKTLAAGWLATQLGIPLYRVDLAAVTSKYIGETEKNLAQLLARAEQAEVVLLFDEADSLFGKRTEVQQANDRFANAQTNYLLQRIESFDGITILTSNSQARFDEAFSRRLDLVIEFPMPRPQERLQLWESHLGRNHDLTVQELNELSATADLCGGHIRNAVLAAAVLAQKAMRKIGWDDLLQGVEVEYRKLGQQMPARLRGA